MNLLIIANVIVNMGITCLAGWLLTVCGQPRSWRIVLGISTCGALCNLAGLIWFGYTTVWPGEPLMNGGFWMTLFGLCFFGQPLVTHRRGGA